MLIFFLSDYEITAECVAGSNLSYANEPYRNQNKDRNTGGFNKMHVHFTFKSMVSFICSFTSEISTFCI